MTVAPGFDHIGPPELKAIALAVGIIGTWAFLRYAVFRTRSR